MFSITENKSQKIMSLYSILSKLLMLLLCWPHAIHAREGSDQRPNFIFIFADDLGYGDLKCYGHPYAKTDNLDRMAREGTLFRYFHTVGNICPPSRAGFMTSRYPSWFPNYTPDYGFMGAITVTQILKDAGYVTGHIGKWNIGDPKPDKSNEGFPYDAYGMTDVRVTGDGRTDPRGKEGPRFDLAMEFVEQYKDVPFYLNVWMYAPHSPVEPPQYLIDEFDDLDVDRSLFGEHHQEKFDKISRLGGSINTGMKTYLGEVYGMDMQIGRLLDKLDDLGLTNDTVVLFSSDNGPAKIDHRGEINFGSGYAGGLRGGKHAFYEGGVSVPFILRYPGHVPAGKVNNASFTSALDWLPTVATLAKANFSWDLVEGEDVSDIWFGSNRSRKKPTFYQDPGSGSIAVHYGGWKMYDYDDRLYDLSTDRNEFVNLYDDEPEIVAALKALKSQYKATIPDDHRSGGSNPLPFDPLQPVTHLVIPQVLLDNAVTAPPSSPPTSSLPTSSPPTSSPPTSAPPTSSPPNASPPTSSPPPNASPTRPPTPRAPWLTPPTNPFGTPTTSFNSPSASPSNIASSCLISFFAAASVLLGYALSV